MQLISDQRSLIVAMMEISTVGKDLVTIRGVADDKYICMNRQNGQMFARVSC